LNSTIVLWAFYKQVAGLLLLRVHLMTNNMMRLAVAIQILFVNNP
jgi:hypothetical protein